MQVQCESLRYGYEPGREVLRGVTATFSEGVTALLGPNGSGKSTLLSLLAGRLRPSGGAIARPPGATHLAAQRPELDPDMTVRELLELFEALCGGAAPGSSELVATSFELRPMFSARVSTLSGGNKRRVHLALAFLGEPSFLALDEPTSGLDQGALEILATRLSSISGVAVVATHDLSFAARVATRFVLMRAEGVIEVEEGNERMLQRYRERFGGPHEAAVPSGRSHVRGSGRGGGRVA
jgi:ABC-type multidrug transport system ATPase subunit